MKGNPIDGRSDVYSLGVVLYQMVTGMVPFSASAALAVAMRHVNDEPLPPTAAGADCPKWLETIIMRALAKEPVDRFDSAADMASALSAAAPVPVPTTVVATGPDAAGPAGQPARRPRSRRVLVASASAAALTIVAVVIGWLSYTGVIPLLTPRVPSVAGLQQGQASAVLNEAGRYISIAEHAYDDNTPDEHVVSQDPAQGTRLKRGETVKLVISKGPEPKVPDLVRMKEGEARSAIERRRLALNVVRRTYHKEIAKDRVISQEPAAGTLLARGDSVEVVLSNGPTPPAEVVPVVGMSESQARAALVEAGGFSVQVTRRDYSDQPEGYVFSQDPKGGTWQERGDLVSIAISRGQPDLELPRRLPGSWRRVAVDRGAMTPGVITFYHGGKYDLKQSDGWEEEGTWRAEWDSGLDREVMVIRSTRGKESRVKIDFTGYNRIRWRKASQSRGWTDFERL